MSITEYQSDESYQRAKLILQGDLFPVGFFEWIESEIVGRWNKSKWTPAILKHFHEQIYLKYPIDIITAAAVKIKSAKADDCQVPYAEILVRARRLFASRQVDRKLLKKHISEEAPKNGE